MPSFAFHSLDGGSSRAGETPLRLRDWIAGLRSGDIAAATILGRLDSNLSDEVRAEVAHRGVAAEAFLANVLMAFALDVADETWRRIASREGSAGDDSEAEALGDLVAEAVRQTLSRELLLSGNALRQAPSAGPGRRVG